jgi:hypothetical protein
MGSDGWGIGDDGESMAVPHRVTYLQSEKWRRRRQLRQ